MIIPALFQEIILDILSGIMNSCDYYLKSKFYSVTGIIKF